MELKIFTTFKTIVRTGSFTKAARLLSYTPSTITFHIAQMEKLTGVPLFEKSGRRMILTKAGEELIPYVDEVLAAVKKVKSFQYGIATYQGTLTVGAPESLLCFRLRPCSNVCMGMHRVLICVCVRSRAVMLLRHSVTGRSMSVLHTRFRRETRRTLPSGRLRSAPCISTHRLVQLYGARTFVSGRWRSTRCR